MLGLSLTAVLLSVLLVMVLIMLGLSLLAQLFVNALGS